MTSEASRSAGQRATHSDGSMLPGEDPSSTDPEDVQHWVAVYRELLSGIARAGLADGSETDLRLQRTAERYSRRLRYWTERQRSR